jgi:hypothetical protein
MFEYILNNFWLDRKMFQIKVVAFKTLAAFSSCMFSSNHILSSDTDQHMLQSYDMLPFTSFLLHYLPLIRIL